MNADDASEPTPGQRQEQQFRAQMELWGRILKGIKGLSPVKHHDAIQQELLAAGPDADPCFVR